MPDIEVVMSSATSRMVMSTWLGHDGISRTVMIAPEMKWTGSGTMVIRRLGGLQNRED